MPYIENRLVHDADAHIMETPNWLRDHADPSIRDRLPQPGYVNELRQTGDNESQLADVGDAVVDRSILDPEWCRAQRATAGRPARDPVLRPSDPRRIVRRCRA